MDINSCLKGKMAGGVGALPCWYGPSMWLLPSACPLCLTPSSIAALPVVAGANCSVTFTPVSLYTAFHGHCLLGWAGGGMGWWGSGEKAAECLILLELSLVELLAGGRNGSPGRGPFYTSCVPPLLPHSRGSDQLSPAPSTRPSPP